MIRKFDDVIEIAIVVFVVFGIFSNTIKFICLQVEIVGQDLEIYIKRSGQPKKIYYWLCAFSVTKLDNKSLTGII